VHDLLAFLAEEMLRLNKEKRALQKTFLAYFVDELQMRAENGKPGIEVLTGKSKLLEFAGDYQKGEQPLTPDGLWEIVQKNRSRLDLGASADILSPLHNGEVPRRLEGTCAGALPREFRSGLAA
jgi:hypothetical protein